ncbi:MAG: VOC family protein [Gemmatimonadales bacterium]|jgi:catechol 2,3-dioxygenase-like lactoylglutathione lyase family enzyme
MPAKKKSARKPARKAARKAARPKARPSRKQPETLRLRAATPGYTVNDIQRSVAWYQNVLGCILVERWEKDGELRGATLRAGTVEFYLGQDDWKLGRDRVKGAGFRIYCTTSQNVDTIAAGIKARGGTFLHDPQDEPWGERDFAIADPDGFKITISQVRRAQR